MTEQQPRGVTSLLDHLATDALDPDYAVSANRRPPGPKPPMRLALSHPPVVAVMAAFGLLVGVAAIVTSRQAPVVDAQRV